MWVVRAYSYVVISIPPSIVQARSTMKLVQCPKQACRLRAKVQSGECGYDLQEVGACFCTFSEFLGSSSAVTDCFTSSNLLLIRCVISDKCRRRHAERGILAQIAWRLPAPCESLPIRKLVARLATFEDLSATTAGCRDPDTIG